MRYATRRSIKSQSHEDDDVFFMYSHSPMPMVFESDDDFIDTGILDENGDEIVRYVGVLPIGFLADHSDE